MLPSLLLACDGDVSARQTLCQGSAIVLECSFNPVSARPRLDFDESVGRPGRVLRCCAWNDNQEVLLVAVRVLALAECPASFWVFWAWGVRPAPGAQRCPCGNPRRLWLSRGEARNSGPRWSSEKWKKAAWSKAVCPRPVLGGGLARDSSTAASQPRPPQASPLPALIGQRDQLS